MVLTGFHCIIIIVIIIIIIITIIIIVVVVDVKWIPKHTKHDWVSLRHH